MPLCALQVSKILGRERTASYLKDAFLHLLKDPTYMVQAKLFENLQQVLGTMSISYRNSVLLKLNSVVYPNNTARKAYEYPFSYQELIYLLLVIRTL